MSLFMKSPLEVAALLAERLKGLRLTLNLSQKTLAERSGVSYGVLKRFEQTGKISLDSLLKLSLVLGALENFDHLFIQNTKPSSLNDLFKGNPRKRGRR